MEFSWAVQVVLTSASTSSYFPQFFHCSLLCFLTEGSLFSTLSCSHLCVWYCKELLERPWSLIFPLMLCRAKRVKVAFNMSRQGFIHMILHSYLMSFIWMTHFGAHFPKIFHLGFHSIGWCDSSKLYNLEESWIFKG